MPSSKQGDQGSHRGRRRRCRRMVVIVPRQSKERSSVECSRRGDIVSRRREIDNRW
jgi:hypothetical protein